MGGTAAGVHGQDRRDAAVQGVRVQRVYATADEEQDPSAGKARGRRPHYPLRHLACELKQASMRRNAHKQPAHLLIVLWLTLGTKYREREPNRKYQESNR